MKYNFNIYNVNFTINGKNKKVSTQEYETLYDFLNNKTRDKFLNRCDIGRCGKCIVLINNKMIPACQIPIFSIENAEILNFEGIKSKKEFINIVETFKKNGYSPCRECFELRIVQSYYFIKNKIYSEKEIGEEVLANWCHCSSFLNYLISIKEICNEKRTAS